MLQPSDIPFRLVEGGVLLFLRVTPKASRAALQGFAPTAEGGVVVKVAVTAPPEDGKANAAVIALLAKHLKLPKSAFSVASGATDRRKSLMIAGDPLLLSSLLMEKLAP